MNARAALLASLDVISHETTMMLNVLGQTADVALGLDLREVKERVLKIRGLAHELFDGLTEADEPGN